MLLSSNGAAQWTTINGLKSGQPKHKASVSEWLLISASVVYLRRDRDYDAHTPLFIEVHAICVLWWDDDSDGP